MPTTEKSAPTAPSPNLMGGEFSYALLKGHNRTDGSYKTDEQLRMEYLQLTDRLVNVVTKGAKDTDPATGEEVTRPYDNIIFLDKSARPVAWLMKEMWPTFASDADGVVAPLPAINFLNIDREQWVNTVDPNGTGYMDVERVDPSVIRSLRSIFIKPQDKANGLTEEIDTTSTSLDGKNILVIDEVLSTGRTLDIANKFLRRAFPTATVSGTYWMKGVTTRNSGLSRGNADLPVWYNEKVATGRGVGDRNSYSSSSENLTQRLGRWFLSSRFDKPDKSSLQLREELKHLAHFPDVPLRPSVDRDDEDYDERLARYNRTTPELAQAAIRRVLNQKD